MKKRYWIAEIRCSPAVEAKIRTKHNVTLEEVREATLFNLQGRIHRDPHYGERLIVRGTTYRGDVILSILKAVNEEEGIWELKTARRER